MISTSIALPLSPAARLGIAGAFSGLLALLAFGPLTAAKKAPELATVAAPAPRAIAEDSSAPLRTYAYYPEQLAALQSLSQFQPFADAGERPVTQAAPLARLGAVETKAARRAEPGAKTAMAATAPQTTASAPESKNATKFFGMPLPDASDLGGRVAGLRETAARWGETAAGWGGNIAKLWR